MKKCWLGLKFLLLGWQRTKVVRKLMHSAPWVGGSLTSSVTVFLKHSSEKSLQLLAVQASLTSLRGEMLGISQQNMIGFRRKIKGRMNEVSNRCIAVRAQRDVSIFALLGNRQHPITCMVFLNVRTVYNVHHQHAY